MLPEWENKNDLTRMTADGFNVNISQLTLYGLESAKPWILNLRLGYFGLVPYSNTYARMK